MTCHGNIAIRIMDKDVNNDEITNKSKLNYTMCKSNKLANNNDSTNKTDIKRRRRNEK